MLPTILTFVEQPVEKEAEAPLMMDVSRPNLVRDSVFRGGSMSFVSAFDENEIDYENGSPTYKGNRIFKCFKNRGNGLLFRIVNDDEFKWAFYNDMTDYTMTVTCQTGANSHVRPLGSTVMTTNETTQDKTLVVTVGPTETEMFLDGVPKGFKLSYEAKPIPRSECLARHIKITDANMLSQNLQGVSDDDSQQQQRGSAMKKTSE